MCTQGLSSAVGGAGYPLQAPDVETSAVGDAALIHCRPSKLEQVTEGLEFLPQFCGFNSPNGQDFYPLVKLSPCLSIVWWLLWKKVAFTPQPRESLSLCNVLVILILETTSGTPISAPFHSANVVRCRCCSSSNPLIIRLSDSSSQTFRYYHNVVVYGMALSWWYSEACSSIRFGISCMLIVHKASKVHVWIWNQSNAVSEKFIMYTHIKHTCKPECVLHRSMHATEHHLQH